MAQLRDFRTDFDMDYQPEPEIVLEIGAVKTVRRLCLNCLIKLLDLLAIMRENT